MASLSLCLRQLSEELPRFGDGHRLDEGHSKIEPLQVYAGGSPGTAFAIGVSLGDGRAITMMATALHVIEVLGNDKSIELVRISPQLAGPLRIFPLDQTGLWVGLISEVVLVFWTEKDVSLDRAAALKMKESQCPKPARVTHRA